MASKEISTFVPLSTPRRIFPFASHAAGDGLLGNVLTCLGATDQFTGSGPAWQLAFYFGDFLLREIVGE